MCIFIAGTCIYTMTKCLILAWNSDFSCHFCQFGLVFISVLICEKFASVQDENNTTILVKIKTES